MHKMVIENMLKFIKLNVKILSFLNILGLPISHLSVIILDGMKYEIKIKISRVGGMEILIFMLRNMRINRV
jgi:hypothetical protein